jgi:hypothetical protein
MTKEQRLAYMRTKFPKLEQKIDVSIVEAIPVKPKEDDSVEVVMPILKGLVDVPAFEEFKRDNRSNSEALTSDET